MRLPPRLWRILRSRRFRIGLACSPFALALGLTAFYAGMNAWGLHAQRAFFAGLPARGCANTLESYFGPPGGPGQDLFSHPAMEAELSDHKIADAVAAFKKRPVTKRYLAGAADVKMLTSRPVATDKEAAVAFLTADPIRASRWKDLRTAFRAPAARWLGGSLRDVGARVLGTRPYEDFAKMHAIAQMEIGNTTEAFADLQTLIDLERQALGPHPLLISMIAAELHQRAVSDIVWEGIHRDFWDEPTLARIDAALAEFDPAHAAVDSFRGELAYAGSYLQSPGPEAESITGIGGLKDLDWLHAGSTDWKTLGRRLRTVWLLSRPSGFAHLDEKHTSETYLDEVILCNGTPRERFDLNSLKAFRSSFEQSPKAEFFLKGGGIAIQQEDSPWRFVVPAVENSLVMTADLQLLRTGIALERYRLKTGAYPASLGDLVPRFLPKLPIDPFSEAPLHYRLQADGSPLVWSVGANLIDDGGIPRHDRSGGDLIWITEPIPGVTERDYLR